MSPASPRSRRSPRFSRRTATCRFRATSGRLGDGASNGGDGDLKAAWAAFDAGGREFWQQMDALVDMLDGAVAEETADA